MSFGVSTYTDYSMWSLKSQSSFKKKKQIQLNHPLYSPRFTPNDVYLLQKLGLSSKQEDLALFRYLKVCHRGIYNTKEDSNWCNEHVTSTTVFLKNNSFLRTTWHIYYRFYLVNPSFFKCVCSSRKKSIIDLAS